MVSRTVLRDRFFFQAMVQGLGRRLNNHRFQLLFVEAQQLIDLEFDLLADSQSIGVEILQCGEVKEDVVAEVFRSDETELAVLDDGDDLADSHRIWFDEYESKAHSG